MLLKSDLYKTHKAKSKKQLFGLAAGQKRTGAGAQTNLVWYNKNGDQIGYGDLSIDDIRRIQRELHDDEAFVIVRNDQIDPAVLDDLTVNTLINSAVGVIANGQAQVVGARGNTVQLGAHTFDVITRNQLQHILSS